MQRKSKPVEPLASFTEEGDLVWNTVYGSGGENKRIREAFEGRRRRGQENDLALTWGNANWRSL